ncbi:NucA/NucB deoxyribonuclease domain-containing protein [Streptomyces sp. NRRL F-5126]|uniref:NucA/NucB deoxyribonuclease domain-containing protein n=1 Tax=Streptomyces sp. NRRL F-5126 TaxID=1463857 RepID=UPI000A83212D|nr:NucA/NucB deoxyribonuclease domain-containing protein [Streptomyces sp. NRRL F-5126]
MRIPSSTPGNRKRRGRIAALLAVLSLLTVAAAGTAQASTGSGGRSGGGATLSDSVVRTIDAQADAARAGTAPVHGRLAQAPQWAKTAAHHLRTTGSALITDDTRPTTGSGEPARITVPGGDMTVRQLMRKAAAARGPEASATAPAPAAANADDDMTVNECVNNHGAYGRGQGYGKTRFVSCQAQRLHMLYVDCWWFGINCRVKAAADVTVADIRYTENAGKGSSGRYFWNYQFLSGFHVWGDLSKLSLTVDESCTAQTVSGHASGPCTGSDGPTTKSLAAWYAEAEIFGGITWTVHDWEQPASAGWGPDRLSYARLRWHYRVKGSEVSIHPDGPPAQVRCDSAAYLRADAGEGCVFPWVTETMWFSLAKQGGSAQNVKAGLYSPASTKPPKAGKSIPGRPGTTPLHRTRDTTQVDAHRAQAVASCDTYFPGYRAKKEQCDEFPFASTLEGATPALNYSVKAISRSDNASGGAVEKNFWTLRRIIADDADKVNDPFWVDVRA